MRRVVFVFLTGGFVLAAQDAPERLRSLVEQAQAAEQQNRLTDAVSLYEEILRVRPGWASAELNLGLVYHSRADYEKAIQILSSALGHDPNLQSALLFRGTSLYHTGRYDEAIRDLSQYLHHETADADALSYLANSHLARNDHAEAAIAYASLAEVTGQPSAYFQLSECYVQLAGRAMASLSGEEARPYRLRILESERSATQVEPCEVPGETEITQARCDADHGEFAAATRTLIRVVQTPKISQQTIYLTIAAYRRLAQASLGKVTALDPESSWARLARAATADRSGNIDAAESEYKRAIESQDSDLESYVRFGQFQARHGRLDRGLVLYEQALKLEPQNPRVMGLIGEVHLLEGRPEKAVPFLEHTVRANPRDTQSRLYLAQSLVRLARPSEAIQILEAAPEDIDGRVHYLLGRTYQQQGEAEKSRRAMDEFRKRRNAIKP